MHRRCRDGARRRQGAGLRVPRRRRRSQLDLAADQRHRRHASRIEVTHRPEPERDVCARREEPDPRLVERRPAHRVRRRPEGGDDVTVKVRAKGGASLAEILATPAAVVADRGARKATGGKPLFLYIGTVAGGQSGGHISLHVTSGNWRGLKTMLGQSSVDQTFSYDTGTIFLLWQGRVPTVIEPSQLKAGDRISIRIRAARASTLAQVEAEAGEPRRRPRARAKSRRRPPSGSQRRSRYARDSSRAAAVPSGTYSATSRSFGEWICESGKPNPVMMVGMSLSASAGTIGSVPPDRISAGRRRARARRRRARGGSPSRPADEPGGEADHISISARRLRVPTRAATARHRPHLVRSPH